MKVWYNFWKYRWEVELSATYSWEIFLSKQVERLPYSKQIAILYSYGFTPEKLTGEQEIIILRHTGSKKCIVLQKWLWVFAFSWRIVFNDVRFVYLWNSIAWFQVHTAGKWYLYFRDNTSSQARESQSPCFVSQVRNGWTRDGSFRSFQDIGKATNLHFTCPVSNDVRDILENPARY